jgi:hypothetical protein
MPLAPSAASPKVSGGIDPLLLARALRPVLAAALDQLGDKEVAEVQEAISIPVVFTVGREQKHRVVKRSSPGEPPRMEEGVLITHVRHDVSADDASGLPSLTISASRPPENADHDPEAAVILEFGRGRVAARPYMRPALTRLEGYAVDFLAARLGE